jgi:uncharacterized protein (TIGR00369 family)
MAVNSTLDPKDPDFEARVQYSFNRQNVMKTLGAEMTKIDLGRVEIELHFNSLVTQQHGYLHAGIVSAIVDSACGYAAYTLMGAQSEVLTVEYKINFLAPAKG